MPDNTSSTSAPLTLESVKQQVDQLASQVSKHSKAIVDTGRHILKLEVDKERKGLSELRLGPTEVPNSRIPHGESDDEGDDEKQGAIDSEDIVELVTELQGQLDILDDRSVRRTANAFVTSDEAAIAGVPGRDGLVPTTEEEHEFPKTLKEFKALKDSEVEFWLRYYELLPPDEAELQEILKRAGTTMEEMGVEQKHETTTATKEESDKNYDTLARYLGIRDRRTAGAW